MYARIIVHNSVVRNTAQNSSDNSSFCTTAKYGHWWSSSPSNTMHHQMVEFSRVCRVSTVSRVSRFRFSFTGADLNRTTLGYFSTSIRNYE